MNMESASLTNPIENGLTIHQRIERGRHIGRLYVAAQHLSMAASNEACRLLEEANDSWQNFGFNQTLAKSPFPTRARSGLRPEMHLTPGTHVDMMTEPWMHDRKPSKNAQDTFSVDACKDGTFKLLNDSSHGTRH